MRVNCLIIGGGVIGSAIAYELSRRGLKDVHVVDPSLEGALSSTERNAGGVRHLWQHPINVELARRSISFFESIKTEIGFQQSGYLWLYGKADAQAGKDLLAHTRRCDLAYEDLSVDEIRRRCPFIDKTDDLAFGIFGLKDGLLNSNAVKNYFRREAKAHGTTFHDGTFVTRVENRGNRAWATSTELSPEAAEAALKDPLTPPLGGGAVKEWDADWIILAAGAWTRPLLTNLVDDPGISPIRRQISIFKAENFDMNAYGMIVDTSRVYFHPEGGNILAGFVIKDEAPGFRFDYDSDFFESHIWSALYERSSKLERLKPVSGWGGLYSYTRDTSGILGKIPSAPNIIEAHSFTGRGVMQSYGAAIAVGELILDGGYKTIPAESLSRARFASNDPRAMLFEQLHI